MSRHLRTVRFSLLLVVLAAGALVLAPEPVSAAPGYTSISIGFGHGWHHRGHVYYRHYRPHFFRYPSYYWGPSFYWGYTPVAHPVAYEDVGAVQLKVSPKKTDVYVDGQYVGRSGKFDGFPGYLWLERGEHSLVLYKEGFRTLEERIEVRRGMITEVRIEMEVGEAIAPEELYRERRPAAPAPAPEPRERATPPRRDRAGEAPDRILDLQSDGGQVRLAIEPPDATVYLDGRFLGTGADLARLHDGLLVDAGQHTLDVLHPGYQPQRLSFRVEAGEALEVRVTLEPPAPEDSSEESEAEAGSGPATAGGR